jgi:hypothetical protein
MQPGFSATMVPEITTACVMITRQHSVGSARGWDRRRRRFSTLQQLIELTFVQPNAAAGWAVINFNALALCHHQNNVGAIWTFHAASLVEVFKFITNWGLAGSSAFSFANQNVTP